MSRLEELYAKVAEFECKGHCAACCGNINVGPAERQSMIGKGIIPPEIHESPCRHLTFNGRCRIHPDRPMVCRLYGTSEYMRCRWGCEPVMTAAEGHELLKAALGLGRLDV